MKITKYEQSGFLVETESGFRLAFDIGNKTPIEKINNDGGICDIDALLISHIHGDHFDISNIKKISPKNLYLNAECLEEWEKVNGEEKSPETKDNLDQKDDTNDSIKITKIKSGDSIMVGDISVRYFTVDHGPNISAPVENLGFILEADGQKIYFAGDMFYEPGLNIASGIEDISDMEVEYLLLPIGTFYTFGPDEAFTFAKKFKHIGKIIPMHYDKTPETRDAFIELAGGVFDIL